MKLSPCIEWIFAAEHEKMGDRLRAAAACGFPQGEFHLWRDKDIDSVREAMAETGATLTGICVDPRRSLVDPSHHEELLTAIAETIEIAKGLGSPPLIIASGFRMEGVSDEDQIEAAKDVLKRAATLAEESDIILVLEPLNDQDLPGMYLVSTKLGLDLVEAVGSPNLRLLYDVYHSKTMGEDIAQAIDGRTHLIHHVQFADFPGRNEPGTGTVDWPAVMALLERNGYVGDIGLEYFPTLPPEASLAFSQKTLGF